MLVLNRLLMKLLRLINLQYEYLIHQSYKFLVLVLILRLLVLLLKIELLEMMLKV
jgi:hypothetical protein